MSERDQRPAGPPAEEESDQNVCGLAPWIPAALLLALLGIGLFAKLAFSTDFAPGLVGRLPL